MYISNANLKRIMNQVDEEELPLDSLYISDLKFCLSEAELIFLGKAKVFFQKINRLKMMFSPVKAEDKKIYIFEGKLPCYHISASCENLKSDWVNYYLPESIRAKGAAQVDRFRVFVGDHLRSKGSISDPDLWIAIQAQFEIKDENLGKITKENSGVSDFSLLLEGKSFEYIDMVTAKIYEELDGFKLLSLTHRKIYDTRYFSPSKIKNMYKNRSSEEMEVAVMLADLKAKLMLSLVELYKKESNFDGIEESVLVELGFRKCLTCFNAGRR